MTIYYSAISNPTGEGTNVVSPNNIHDFVPDNFKIKTKTVDDLIVYKIEFSDADGDDDSEGSTMFDGYYVYDASGELYAAKFKITSYGYDDEVEDPDVSEIDMFVGSYPITVPTDYKKFENAKESDQPFSEF